MEKYKLQKVYLSYDKLYTYIFKHQQSRVSSGNEFWILRFPINCLCTRMYRPVSRNVAQQAGNPAANRQNVVSDAIQIYTETNADSLNC